MWPDTSELAVGIFRSPFLCDAGQCTLKVGNYLMAQLLEEKPACVLQHIGVPRYVHSKVRTIRRKFLPVPLVDVTFIFWYLGSSEGQVCASPPAIKFVQFK